MRWIWILLLCVACAPSVLSQRERADAADRSEAASLERQIHEIPGVTGVYAALHRTFTDPLTGAHSDSAASVLIMVDHNADRAMVEHTTRALAPTASVAIVTAPSPAPSQHGLLLMISLVAVLAAAGFVAWRARPTA